MPRKPDTTVFIVKNISARKTIRLFGVKIRAGQSYDLLNIPYVSEELINFSLLKGDLISKLRAGEIIIENSNINLIKFDPVHREALRNFGITEGVEANASSELTSGESDPTDDAPSPGARYYNTVLQKWMYYDSSRQKFLSEESVIFPFGSVGSLAAGGYFSSAHGLALSSSIGYTAEFNGTIVAIGYSTDTQGSSIIEFTANGSTLGVHTVSSVSKLSTTLNIDFTQGSVLAIRNFAGGSTLNNVSGWFKIKWTETAEVVDNPDNGGGEEPGGGGGEEPGGGGEQPPVDVWTEDILDGYMLATSDATGEVPIYPVPATVLGTTYEVGPGREYEDLNTLPVASLTSGDLVLIYHRDTPYRTKLMIRTQATAEAPLIIQGVPNNDGYLPEISAENALLNGAFDIWTHNLANIIVFGSYGSKPSNIKIVNLKLTGAHPNNQFTGVAGIPVAHANGASGIWVRADNVSIKGCIISGNANGIFTQATNQDIETISTNILIEACSFSGNGVVGSDRQHNLYIQSKNALIQFNTIHRLATGVGGSSYKDRCSGTIFRYNWVETSARTLDFVEPEDTDTLLMLEPNWADVYVYGNYIVNTESSSAGGGTAMIHYGGDNGELNTYRNGNLWFYNNIVYINRRDDPYYMRLFDMNDTTMTADVVTGTVKLYNNLIYNYSNYYTTPKGPFTLLREYGEVEIYGGNWISSFAPTAAANGATLVANGSAAIVGTENLLTLNVQSNPANVNSVFEADVNVRPGFVLSSTLTSQIPNGFVPSDLSLCLTSPVIVNEEVLPENLFTNHPVLYSYQKGTVFSPPFDGYACVDEGGGDPGGGGGDPGGGGGGGGEEPPPGDGYVDAFDYTGNTGTYVEPLAYGLVPIYPVPNVNGTIYEVGPGKAYTEISDLPINSLGGGDLVKVHYRTDPYRTKVLLNIQATSADPFIIQGIPNSDGYVPIITSENANMLGSFTASNDLLGTFVVMGATKPSYIRIVNFDVRGAHPSYSFTGVLGAGIVHNENAAGAYILGDHIAVLGCIFRNNANGVTATSSGTLMNEISTSILVEGCYFENNGTAAGFRQANINTVGIDIVSQFNTIKSLVTNSASPTIKDRSAGYVFRYNWAEMSNTFILEFLDPSNSYATIGALAGYDQTHIYGNQLLNITNGLGTSLFHYGGDSGTVSRYRDGYMWMYDNIIYSNRADSPWSIRIFEMDDSDATAAVRTGIAPMYNNTLYQRGSQDTLSMIRVDGRVALGGGNWMSTFKVSYTAASISNGTATVTGQETLLAGASPGFVDTLLEGALNGHAVTDLSLQPTAPAVANRVALPAELNSYPVSFKYSRGKAYTSV